jgi:hypothetical protein
MSCQPTTPGELDSLCRYLPAALNAPLLAQEQLFLVAATRKVTPIRILQLARRRSHLELVSCLCQESVLLESALNFAGGVEQPCLCQESVLLESALNFAGGVEQRVFKRIESRTAVSLCFPHPHCKHKFGGVRAPMHHALLQSGVAASKFLLELSDLYAVLMQYRACPWPQEQKHERGLQPNMIEQQGVDELLLNLTLIPDLNHSPLLDRNALAACAD